jgi:hypothetical protein
MALGRGQHNVKIHQKGAVFGLGMMGEGGGDVASWWEGQVWVEMRTKMSNPAERQWTKQQEMSKIAKKEMCVNYFACVLLGEVPEVGNDIF